MILVSNCPHGNGVYTLIDHAANIVVKSSYSVEGMAGLAREHAGYQWYLGLPAVHGSIRHAGERLTHTRQRAYSRLVVGRFGGRAGNPYGRFSANYHDAMLAIATYAEIWPDADGGLCALHGDFSLGNMIFAADGTVGIVDWEHFHASAAPWGFDLVNLVYECAFFSAPDGAPLGAADLEAFVEARARVRELARSRQGFDCTLDSLTTFVATHAAIWGPLVKKLPVLKFSGAQQAQLTALESGRSLPRAS